MASNEDDPAAVRESSRGFFDALSFPSPSPSEYAPEGLATVKTGRLDLLFDGCRERDLAALVLVGGGSENVDFFGEDAAACS